MQPLLHVQQLGAFALQHALHRDSSPFGNDFGNVLGINLLFEHSPAAVELLVELLQLPLQLGDTPVADLGDPSVIPNAFGVGSFDAELLDLRLDRTNLLQELLLPIPAAAKLFVLRPQLCKFGFDLLQAFPRGNGCVHGGRGHCEYFRCRRRFSWRKWCVIPVRTSSSLGGRETSREEPMALWIVLAVVAVVVLWGIWAYNRLVNLRNQVANGWRQIDVQLKRRYDLIPNLVNAVRGYMKYEQETLERVIQARNQALGARSVGEAAQREAELAGVLGRLFALMENYPELKANQNVLQLQEELTSTENKIAFARQFYNDVATKYNIARETFPSNIIAKLFGFQAAELFAVADEREREAPQVNLSW
jgi:LemA protein